MSKDNDRIPIHVVGLSYSQNQQGAYALILGQKDSPIRIPIIIGGAEAQAIALTIEGVNAPRPLTHDLMASIIHAFDIRAEGVFIYKFEDGVFSSEITLVGDGRQVTIDCRTSDAVALALRLHCPITTTRAVLEETGFVIEGEESDDVTTEAVNDQEKEAPPAPALEDMPLEELQRRLREAIASEMYEDAAIISEIIKKRENS